MSDIGKHIDNELNVAGRVADATPGKILDELQNDWNNNKSKLVATTLESAAIGFAFGAAYKAAPLATTLAAGVMTGLGVLDKAAPMVKGAWNADSEEQRSMLTNQFSSDFGRTGATMVEGLPGFAIGGKAASISLAQSEGLRNFAYNNITKPIEFPLQERWSFRGPGSSLLPEGALKAGSVDALKLSETLPSQNRVEMARSLDLERGRASRVFKGTESEVAPTFEDKSGRVLIHTHPLEGGPRPGLYDIKATADFGIIRSGDYRSFYIGQKGLNTGEAQLKSLILDDANKQAFLLHNLPGKEHVWKYSAPQYVDYESATSALRTLDVKNAWSQFQNLPKVASEAHPEHILIAEGKKLGV
ncbi:MAG TPA: hypothetical protein V6C76_11375 [Drouetiella sp.]